MSGVPFIRSVIVNSASTVNSAITSYTFLITPTIPINNSYSIILKFPPEIELPTDQSLYKCTSDDFNIISQVQCVNHFAFVANGVRVVIGIKPPLRGINPLQTFKITINSIKNPPTTKPSGRFEVNITDPNLSILSRLNVGTGSIPVTIMTNTPYTLTKATFSANTTGAGQTAKYTIKIYPENTISIGGGVLIVYPSQIGV